MDNMVERIYILTRQGRAYTEEGCQKVIKLVDEWLGLAEDFQILQGEKYNDSTVLGKELLDYAGESRLEALKCCIAISCEKIHLLGGTDHNIKGFIADAEEHPYLSSWEIFMEELKTLEE